MSKLRISDAPLLPDVDGTEKIPTGGRGDYAISVDQIKDHIFEDVGKELVGLGNVDNTSDLDKPVSTAQQAALNLKADKTYVDTNLDLKADKTNVYTRTETTLALSQKADLVNGVVPSNQLPSYVDDVVEYTTNTLPIVGESGKIYVTTDTNRTWRWSGNQYVEISNGGVSDSTLKLQTPRKIANVDFDGTQNIDIPHNNLMNRDVDGAHPASAIFDASGVTQQEINDLTGAPYRVRVGGYKENERVVLANGDIVKSTVDGNTNNPNSDMTGWELADAALNSQKLKRENVSVWDFFTAEELTAYKANPTTYDASEQLQAFFDYCHANKVINANAGGTFYTTKSINYTGSEHATNVMLGDLTLTTDKPLAYMLHITGQSFQFLGSITLSGAGGSAAERTTRCGLLLGHTPDLNTFIGTDCYSTNLYIHAVTVNQVYDVGVYWGNFSHFSAIGRVRGSYIGSCVTDNSWVSNGTTFSAVTTVEGDIFQSSTLTVAKLPYDFSGTALAYINNQLYAITGVNKVAKTITVYPRLPRNVNTGTIWYQQGAVLYTIGNDTSNLRVNTLQAITCGIGADFKALYGCNISTFISEYLGAGIVLSDKHLTTTIGNHVTSGYFEANIADIVYGWFGSNNMLSIAANVALNPAKIISLAPFRQSDDSLVGGAYTQAGGDIFLDNTTYNAANNALTGDLTHASKVHFHHFWGDFTLDISQNLDKGRLFGKYSAMYVFAGTYATSATGIITIKPPSGSVINNTAQMTIDASQYDSAIVVYIYAISSTNYLASVITPKIPSVV